MCLHVCGKQIICFKRDSFKHYSQTLVTHLWQCGVGGHTWQLDTQAAASMETQWKKHYLKDHCTANKDSEVYCFHYQLAVSIPFISTRGVSCLLEIIMMNTNLAAQYIAFGSATNIAPWVLLGEMRHIYINVNSKLWFSFLWEWCRSQECFDSRPNFNWARKPLIHMFDRLIQ